MTSFELIPMGPFSLAASAAFLEGFSPAAYRAAEAGHLHLAFVPDGEEAAGGLCLTDAGRILHERALVILAAMLATASTRPLVRRATSPEHLRTE